LTFILVALLWIGQEIYTAIAVSDNVSNLTHIAGGIVGGIFGFSGAKDKR
jgi:GlpG protein